MENLCRLCGSEDGIKVNIFEPGAERVKKIHKILPITVNEHDPFPKQICHHCSYKVDQFFEFRTRSIKTQEVFRRKVPWLRDKQLPWMNRDEPPMVEVTLNSVNAISPNEKLISPSNGSMYEINEDNAIVIEDSPPYDEHSVNPNILASECELDEQQTPTRKPKKPRPRSLWDSKKRKKKNRKSHGINEVYMTSEQEDQNFNDIENDPLRLSPVNSIENNSFDIVVENNSCTVKSPKSEISVVEKGILTDDKGGVNIDLPKYFLMTKLPRIGNVWTCEKCGITFLTPLSANQHVCPGISVSVEEDRPKEDPQHHHEDTEPDTTKDFYQCSDCGHVFTRHSQLLSHRKKHNNQVDSSSDDSFKAFNKRKKHHTKRKHKPRLLNTNNFNSTNTLESSIPNSTTNFESSIPNSTTNFESSIPISATDYESSMFNTSSNFESSRPNFSFNFDPNITRHSLLSSDSE